MNCAILPLYTSTSALFFVSAKTNEFTFGHSQTIIPCLTDTCILLMNHSDTRIAVCIFVAYITSSVLTSVVDKN